MDMSESKNSPIISLRNVSKLFQGKKVIDDVSLDILPGEIFVIMGCSGSGKSTLLRLMTGAIKADQGSILIKGREITSMSHSELDQTRRMFGMLFQYLCAARFFDRRRKCRSAVKRTHKVDRRNNENYY